MDGALTVNAATRKTLADQAAVIRHQWAEIEELRERLEGKTQFCPRCVEMDAKIEGLRTALGNWHADGSFYVHSAVPHPPWCAAITDDRGDLVYDDDGDVVATPDKCDCGTALLDKDGS